MGDSDIADVTRNLRSLNLEQIIYKPKDFVFGRTLGLGSFSRVVLATNKQTNDIFAMKIVDKSMIVRERKVSLAKMERQILLALNHPGVVRLFFTFQDEFSLYFGLECCDGGDLFELVNRNGPRPQGLVQFLAAELVSILEYIHKLGIIHRDLKPENVVLTLEGHVKLVDFGSAKLTNPNASIKAQSHETGKEESPFVGSADYVSPEVLNEEEVTTSADLWALGCIIFFLLVGTPPFWAKTDYLKFQNIETRKFSIPDSLSDDAKDLIDRLLVLKPNERIGAGSRGFVELKRHSFFEGVNWESLWEAEPPNALRIMAEAWASVEEEDDEDDVDFQFRV